MTITTLYRTSDDQVFEDQEEAHRWEEATKYVEKLTDIIHGAASSADPGWQRHDSSFIAIRILRHPILGPHLAERLRDDKRF